MGFYIEVMSLFFIDVHPFKVKTYVRNLQTIQKKYEEAQKTIEKQKLKIDILEAEKVTLQAEKNNLEAEKKMFEVRFEEVNLKLKLKTAEYDSLLAKQDKDEEKTTAQSTTDQQSEPIVIEDESIEMDKSAPQKGPTTRSRKRKATETSISDSSNKENSVGNCNTTMTRMREDLVSKDFSSMMELITDEDIKEYVDLFVKEEVEKGRDPIDISLKDAIKVYLISYHSHGPWSIVFD